MLSHAQLAITGFQAEGRDADARLARAYRVIALRGSGERDDSDVELEALQARWAEEKGLVGKIRELRAAGSFRSGCPQAAQ